MRELVLTCALAILGSGCVSVVSHIDEYDAGAPDVKPSDGSGEAEVSSGKCFSGKRWSPGDKLDDTMNPGVPCIGTGCHTTATKSPLVMAGTIYAREGANDVDNCNGFDTSMGGAAIAIFDEMGNEQLPRIQVNRVGNFSTNRTLPNPYRVKLFSGGKETPMMQLVSDGNCNYCHSADGRSNAKGRIIPPPPN